MNYRYYLPALLLLVATTLTAQPTGIDVPGMRSYDSVITRLMRKWKIPGGSVAVVKDGRLVYARGFGLADTTTGATQQVDPWSRFRLASLSKPITSSLVMRLVEEGELSLDTKVFPLLQVIPPDGAPVDPRLDEITVRDLLQHSGGWDRETSGDPMFMTRYIASVLGIDPPTPAAEVVRFMMGIPLDFDPGTKSAYSNFGYCVLGRVIEKVTGMSYEEYLRQTLGSIGVTGIVNGHTLMEERLPYEVKYYDYAGSGLAQNVFTGEVNSVPWQYGGYYQEAMDAHGGLIASAIDMMRWLTSIDGRSDRPSLLQKASITQMVARPAPPVAQPTDQAYYALGWVVRPANGDFNWWHNGGLPGTSTFIARVTHQNMSWVALFNSRPESEAFYGELDNALWEAATGVTAFPTHDLFEPVLVHPINGEIEHRYLTKSWSYADRADSFDVQIMWPWDSVVVLDTTVVGTTLHWFTRQSGTYVWKVRAWRDGVAGLWSDTASFENIGLSAPDRGDDRSHLTVVTTSTPTQPHGRILYSLPRRTTVKVEVFDVVGGRVSISIVEAQDAGEHSMTIDVPRSGNYMARVTAGGEVATTMVQIIR